MTDLQKLIREEFPRKKILILGDLVADQFLQGTITRVSREAPVFIMRHDQTQTLPGAAANAAANVASLGGKAILAGVVGEDDNGRVLLDELGKAGVNCERVVFTTAVSTTTKVRVLAGQERAARKQVIRIDYENATFDGQATDTLKKNLSAAIAGADAVLISDYNYGAASPEIALPVIDAAKQKGIPVVIDSRFHLRDFPGATSATPNQDEVEQIAGRRLADNGELEKFCAQLREELGYRALMVTRGSNGVFLFQDGASPMQIEAVGSTEPLDVTGAGDTVIAAYTLGLASGLSFPDAARIANHAGGIVVMKRRTATVSAEELIAAVAGDAPPQSISAEL
jgi:rfaE bifunctional protein kinase chain/domain